MQNIIIRYNTTFWSSDYTYYSSYYPILYHNFTIGFKAESLELTLPEIVIVGGLS